MNKELTKEQMAALLAYANSEIPEVSNIEEAVNHFRQSVPGSLIPYLG